MRYYIIAGEASGDLHGSNLIKALHQKDPNANIRCWGGDMMEQAGATLVKHYRDLAFMGFVEVIKHLGTIFDNIKFCKSDISAFKPDVVVFVDYPGFNMRIAEWAHKQQLKTVYYISPQVWAWKEKRVLKLKRDIDKMLVILPFEVDFYKKWDYPVTYVGHPLTEVVKASKAEKTPVFANKPIIALLPGSRSQEIRIKLPIMLQMVEKFPDFQFIIAQAPSQPDTIYLELAGTLPVKLVQGQTYDLLKQATAALVTSGTATLETALFNVPQVVCYKGNSISFWLATKLVKVKYISLVNLVMDKPVVKELIQSALTAENLEMELRKILDDNNYLQAIQTDYAQLWTMLGAQPASANAAKAIYDSATA